MSKLGDRNGDFILKKRERLENGQWRDTWMLDPVVTLKPSTATHKAFMSKQDNATSAYTSPDNATTECASSDYLQLQDDDGSYLSILGQATLTNRYGNVAQKFTFDTSGYENITDITVKHGGYYGYTGRIPDLVPTLKVYKATAWEAWTNLTTTDTNREKSLGNGSAYFYNTTWIKFGVYGWTRRSSEDPSLSVTLYTDFAWLQITYGVAPPAPRAGLPPALIATILEEA